MPTFQNLPIELFFDVLGRATQGCSLAQVVHLRLVDRRFRDCLIPSYVFSRRLLDTRLQHASAGKAPECYRNLNHFPLDGAKGVVHQFWNDPSFAVPTFPQCVELIERRMCFLVPGLDQWRVHERFCELFARQSTISRGLHHMRLGRCVCGKTVREAFWSFTAFHMDWPDFCGIHCGRIERVIPLRHIVRLLDNHGIGNPFSEEPWLKLEEIGDLKQLDMLVWSAALAFGFVGVADADSEFIDAMGKRNKTEELGIGAITLIVAAIMGEASVIDSILELFPLALNRDELVMALERGAREGHEQVVETLTKDAHVRSSIYDLLRTGGAGLVESCISRSLPCVQLLVQIMTKDPVYDMPNLPFGVKRYVDVLCSGDMGSGRGEELKTAFLTKALVEACHVGTSCEIVDYLIRMGARVNYSPPYEGWTYVIETPWSAAASGGFVRLLRTLVRHGADPTTRQAATDCLEAHGMLDHDDVEMLAAIDGLGCDMASRGAMALLKVAKSGARNILTWLLDNYPERVWGPYGDLAAHHAVLRGHTEILHMLLDRGDQNLSEIGKWYALQDAVTRGRIECAIILLENGVMFRDSWIMAKCGQLFTSNGREDLLTILVLDPDFEPRAPGNR